ncbi:MAG TPA: DUF92 domain-containing protein [Flavipsychrobacter sp.]|nr:DUF92 domain-containing protein [Flavipsychrobacter sp.]
MSFADIGLLLVLIVLVVTSILSRKLTVSGGISGGLVALCIYLGAGLCGVTMLGTFFLAGTLATRWGLRKKEALGYAEHDKGRRKASQVFANGGLAAICGMLAYLLPPYREMLVLMIAASFSSAAADTLSSELGTLYGKSFYNIVSLRPDTRGENGVVSLEGILIGILGSFMIALVYAAFYRTSHNAMTIVLAGTVGNLADSVIGAIWERRGLIKNDAVNFLNTLAAALVALCISYLT